MAAKGPDSQGDKRGLLRPEPKLAWKSGPAPIPAKGPAPAAPKTVWPQGKVKAGAPSNALPQSQYTLEQLKKMAASRGISLEKLLAQMVQQYLKEDTSET